MFFLAFVVLVLAGCGLPTNDIEIAQYEAARAAAEAEKVQAETAKVQAEIDLEQAKSELERAKGERAIMEASARSVDSDRQLVEYYSTRADVRAGMLFVSLFGLAACSLAFVYVMRRREDAKNTKNTQN